MNHEEIQRLAAVGNRLRGDWPFKSLVTFLERHCEDRTFWEASCALVWIATRPGTEPGTYQSRGPQLLAEDGPWWGLTVIVSPTDDPAGTPTETPVPNTGCTYHGTRELPCQQCRDEWAHAATTDRIREIRAQFRYATQDTDITTHPPTPTIDNPTEVDRLNTERARQLAQLQAFLDQAHLPAAEPPA